MIRNISKGLLHRLTSPAKWPGWQRHWSIRVTYSTVIPILLLILMGNILYPTLFRLYTGEKTAIIHFDTSVALTRVEFETLAARMQAQAVAEQAATLAEGIKDPGVRRERERLRARQQSLRAKSGYAHIGYFREAGIRQYEGPKTCLRCHESMKIEYPGKKIRDVDTMEDVVTSLHFRLFKMTPGFSTVGYDGREVNKEGHKIPVGKIDRACGIPGSFTWTGWAAHTKAKPVDGEPVILSEGCGQCHIGGMYGPPTDLMMPLTIKDENRRNAIDCLLCHSRTYDMNQRFVVKDEAGLRWNQDRGMKAAMGVGKPGAEACLRCHQHNMGGDTYENNAAAKALGVENPRMLHAWSKRGTPYHPEHDVHAAAGMDCLDCHRAVGHKIARGKQGADLVANDLPNVEVSCTQCHSDAPHVRNRQTRAMLNGHSERIACQTCHITRLQKNSVVLMDWVNPIFHEQEGLWTPDPLLVSGDVRVTAGYLWYNGTGTFMANALGDNPANPGGYNPLMDTLTRYDKLPGLQIRGGGVVNNDFLRQLSPQMLEKRRRMVKANIEPNQRKGKSKIYPFHLFNALMYEDMNNQGPFGAMIMPFDYTTYFETGNSRKSVETALKNPIIKRFFEPIFKAYIADNFMHYFGIEEGWKADYPLDPDYPGKLEPHWMRQMGTIALNHGIDARGWTCSVCHTAENALLDFRALGYTREQARRLQVLPEIEVFEAAGNGSTMEEVYGPGKPVYGPAVHVR
ncbi:MAG: Cytochrome c554 and c-prime [Candidatus Kentron sp. G]|nr:MAG: Cytochrome c554 and c-prime [Candidatus Kentron sp. G]VFM99073.1 MAG: Cytochrome c554 and c-prime [Candidatus Kentron sp. G]VFN00913.1 MAG: Cytochrome c554 and c-prime [Candidatus Kentron sp. G]